MTVGCGRWWGCPYSSEWETCSACNGKGYIYDYDPCPCLPYPKPLPIVLPLVEVGVRVEIRKDRFVQGLGINKTKVAQ